MTSYLGLPNHYWKLPFILWQFIKNKKQKNKQPGLNYSQSKIWIWANRAQLTQNESIPVTLFTAWTHKYCEKGSLTTFLILSQCWRCSAILWVKTQQEGEKDNINESCHIHHRRKCHEWELLTERDSWI